MSRSINSALWDQWRERLRRFDSSCQTVLAFCQSEGVSQAGFYQWRKKLGRPSRSAGRRQDEGGRAKASPKRPAFVPVVGTSFPSPVSMVVLTLVNGVRVELPATDHALISHVVQTVAAAGGDS
jgi:hypothetical protein